MEKDLLYPVQNQYRTQQSLDGLWQFKFDPEAKGETEQWQDRLETETELPVPASFNDFFTDKTSREYVGDFWYARQFFVPDSWRDKNVYLRFDAATHRAKIFVNGQYIRSHEGGFLPFMAQIDQAVKFGAENTVAIKINNELHRDALPAGDTLTLKNGHKMAKPFFDFYNYSGLNRSVHLVALPKIHLTDYATTYALKQDQAEVHYQLTANTAGLSAQVTLFDAAGQKVASGTGLEGTLNVAQPHLWQVGKGYMYQLQIQLIQNGQVVDQYQDEIGIRTIEIKGHEIFVNNQSVYIRGFGRHEDSNFAGRGFDLKVEKRDLSLMKWIGANAYRTSHYPYDEQAYRMADHAGILIIDEVPAVGFKMAAASFLGGLDQNFFDGDWIDNLYEKHLDQITDLIQRDKNHPSVFAWSLFNEPDTSSEKCVPYFTKIFSATQALDPQSRPRTFTLNEDDTYEASHAKQFPDIFLLNRYPSWTAQTTISDVERRISS